MQLLRPLLLLLNLVDQCYVRIISTHQQLRQLQAVDEHVGVGVAAQQPRLHVGQQICLQAANPTFNIAAQLRQGQQEMQQLPTGVCSTSD